MKRQEQRCDSQIIPIKNPLKTTLKTNKLEEIKEMLDQCIKISLYACSILHEWKEKNTDNESKILKLQEDLREEREKITTLQAELQKIKELEKVVEEYKRRNEDLEKEIKILKYRKKELEYDNILYKEKLKKYEHESVNSV
jgi:selenocysteine-specific translation elongation factor